MECGHLQVEEYLECDLWVGAEEWVRVVVVVVFRSMCFARVVGVVEVDQVHRLVVEVVFLDQ